MQSTRKPHGRRKGKAKYVEEKVKYKVMMCYRIKIGEHNIRDQIC